MRSTDEAFPSPFCMAMDSPQILFESEIAGSAGGAEFFDSAFAQDSPGFMFTDDAVVSPYQSSISTKHNDAKAETVPARNAASFATSPDSSLQDSSSDSSDRHNRQSSSNSSRSGHAGVNLELQNEPLPDCLVADTMMGDCELAVDRSGIEISRDMSYEHSNLAMENDFDFDSAASSPSQRPNSSTHSQPGSRHIAIPWQVSATGAPVLRRPDDSLSNARETALRSSAVMPLVRPTVLKHSQSSPSNTNEDYINGVMLNGMEQLSTLTYDTQFRKDGFPVTLPTSDMYPISITKPLGAIHDQTSPQYGQKIRHTLLIQPTPTKSRVETQIPIKMVLYPLPPGVNKLHLPTHTISKPKLLVKPAPARSPDMLELYTMLVCTSAMQDPMKLRRAFARAAQSPSLKREESCRLSSDEIPLSDDDENKPLNGGEVNICVGCITRERKRAARKKSKKPEEEEPWQQDEARRIIVFNTPEVKEWQHPSTINPGPAIGDGKTYNPNGSYLGSSYNFPESAMCVEIPMRIACYCRHQNEKLGFQVIFTIKDFQDNIIAQSITDSIVITDDHKTHASSAVIPPPGAMFIDSNPLSGVGMFGREPLENYGPAPSRNAYSTTDLQGLQQNFNPHIHNTLMSPFAAPPQSSQTTSTTMTPRNLSRQVSPSTPSGPVHKKRKASISGKIPDMLTMTRIQTSQGASGPHHGWTSSAPVNATLSAGASPYTPSYSSFTGSQIRTYGGVPTSTPTQLNTNPPTPSSNETGFNFANRSQSLDNLQAAQQMMTAPNSTVPSRIQSRVPSPVTTPTMETIHQSHVQAATNSLYGLPNSLNPQRPPTIHKLIPNEGTKAGGIEVTCLGSGFCQGLEVMFGDSLATTTTYWGETSLVCLLPPAIRAGVVPVTFKHHYQQQLQLLRYPSPPLPKQQVYFKYIDDDEQEILRHALALVNQKMNGKVEDVGDFARRIVNSPTAGQGSWSGASAQGGDQQRQSTILQAHFSASVNLETALLKCLDLIDIDDSPYHARLDLRRANGQSILHMSSSVGYHRLVAGLLARGANPDLRDTNGMSPMHMASLNGHPQIVRRLRLAGGDPTLRSLLGYTPADMASSQDVLDAVRALHHHSRSRSAGTNSLRYQSRGSSTTSLRSLWEAPSVYESMDLQDSGAKDRSEDIPGDEDVDGSQAQHIASPVPLWAKSRRNSADLAQSLLEKHGPERLAESAGLLSPAMAAWRDHIAAQIHHFQQNVNWTLPHLQIPALPPMPNLPDYQTYPMVRRISSLVPQRSPRLGSSSGASPDAKDNDYRWWELLTGVASIPQASSLPPAYEEIYPEPSRDDLERKNMSTARAAADALLDQKCAVNFDDTKPRSSSTMKAKLEMEHQEQLRSSHARKVKRLRSDRNLFFIWIPILTLVMVAMLKDRVPQMWFDACHLFDYARTQYSERFVDVV